MKPCSRSAARPGLRALMIALFVGAFLTVATAAPTLAQEKARLVNPKKKDADQKEEAVEPAPAEATDDEAEAAEAKNDAKAAKRERRRAERAAADEAKREREAQERAAKAERDAAAQAERERAANERAAERRARAEEREAERAEAQAAEAAAQPEAAAEAATKAPPPVMAAPKPSGATPIPKAPEPRRAATPAPAPVPAPAPAARDRRSNLPARSPDVVEETIVVSEVLLDVLVTDRKGAVIHGLGSEDFIVTEEGQEVPVTSVTFYGTEEELQGSGVGEEARSDRYFVLLFHDQKQSAPFLTAAQLDAARWTKKWIENDLQPNDQVAVMGYDVRLKLYQDFTRDPALIAQAVEDAALGKKEPVRRNTRSAPDFDLDSPSLFVNLPTDSALAKETRKMQEALALIGRAAEPIVGRKNLLLYSVGYGEIDQGSPHWTPDPRYYPDMKESLNDGNIALYAVDMQGSTRGRPGAARINDSLSSIATDTGGHYYWNFTNHRVPLQQVTKDNLGYYLVSYQTRYPRGEKGYREVEVETRDRSHKVRARQGYRYGGS